MRALPILLVFMFTSSSGFATQSTEQSFERKDSVSFKRDSKEKKSYFRDVSFNRAFLNLRGKHEPVIYKIIRNRIIQDDHEGQSTKLEFSMFLEQTGKPIGAKIKSTKDSLKLVSSNGFYYLAATKYGCCGAENKVDYIRVDTGEIFASFTGSVTHYEDRRDYGKGFGLYVFEKYGDDRYGRSDTLILGV